MTIPRLAVRAVLIHENRLLLVNAWRKGSDLWCAPGGGAEAGSSLPDNLIRELHEETGLHIVVGPPCLINEFHDPRTGYHQVEVFFRCTTASGTLPDGWSDPEGIVKHRRWVTQDEMATLRVKPDSLAHVAWQRGFGYDPLEVIAR
ncbi:NUDIX hydrolase [Actibacterium sp. 188UL27-1]|uniref:NUDIX domain-containing protein n=1 Tax=Actibacterium sp. 188UL27-1 TaxID=2786961 RepID=UPI001959D9CA|nr:NUDIX hydrolase [Actibacterium sp. 188UL27-1]MBM7068732.1 NUDIX hydrolase [Actibacterium sp. 188UL27-1]